MRCTMQITVGQYLFRFLLAKWVGGVCHGAVGHAGGAGCPACGRRLGRRPGRAARDVWHPRRDSGHEQAQCHQICKSRQPAANQRTFGQLPELVLVWFADRPAARRVDGGGFVRAGCWGSASAGCLPVRNCCLRPSADSCWACGTRRTPVRFIRRRHASCCCSTARRWCWRLLSGSGIYQGVTAESYIGPDEIYYAYYMKHISGPFTQESYDWLEQQGEEFAPDARGAAEGGGRGTVQRRDAGVQLAATKVQRLQPGHQPEYQLLSEGTPPAPGWSTKAATKNCSASPARPMCRTHCWPGWPGALCFAGLFSMERRGGMETILCTTPLGRKCTVRAQARGQRGRGSADRGGVLSAASDPGAAGLRPAPPCSPRR